MIMKIFFEKSICVKMLKNARGLFNKMGVLINGKELAEKCKKKFV
jgi:hypothetical protein